jgi:lambda family phage minor tail protein L
MNFGVSIFDTATGGSYLGDGVSGIYMWGAQLEQGQLTSYTPTTSVAGDNPYANPAEEYPVETWIITRKANETPAAIEFELGSPLDLQGVKLPRRQVVAGTCLWAYRSGECGYGGGPVADYADNPTSDPSKDQCSRTMRGCKKRFGENGELPFGGFPGIARVPRL